MFSHKLKTTNIMFLVFGLVTIGVLVLVGVVLFDLSTKDKEKQTEDIASVDSVFEELQLEKGDMIQQYYESIGSLYDEISVSSQSLDTLLSQVEDKLLSLRVPKEMQEIHLDAVLSIARLRVESVNSPDGAMEKLKALLVGLNGK